jgi:hypothetical protein
MGVDALARIVVTLYFSSSLYKFVHHQSPSPTEPWHTMENSQIYLYVNLKVGVVHYVFSNVANRKEIQGVA